MVQINLNSASKRMRFNLTKWSIDSLLNLSEREISLYSSIQDFRFVLYRFENELIVAVGKGEPAAVMAEYGFK